jgi:hypothetical protein
LTAFAAETSHDSPIEEAGFEFQGRINEKDILSSLGGRSVHSMNLGSEDAESGDDQSQGGNH